MSNELAAYIAAYIMEELHRGNQIDHYTILEAVEAYEGGAR